jgi:hypothetical protein
MPGCMAFTRQGWSLSRMDKPPSCRSRDAVVIVMGAGRGTGLRYEMMGCRHLASCCLADLLKSPELRKTQLILCVSAAEGEILWIEWN